MTQPGISARIARLQQMSVAELRKKWQELYGEEPRVRNRVWLWRRLAWQIQANAYGGLSDRALKRLEELMPDAELALRNPRGFRNEKAPASSDHQVRDKRIPPVGTVLLRRYKDQSIAVTILEDGFEWEGRQHRSLSAVAKEVTGSHWNGLRFFNLHRKGESK